MDQQNQRIVERIGLTPGCLNEQVAIVTGAGRGIGREVAHTLAWLGAPVVIAEITESGKTCEQEIISAGGRALFVKTDVSCAEDVGQLAAMAQQTFGAAGILINNAMLCPAVPVNDMDLALWDRVIAVNLRGVFLTCKVFLPAMLARKCGTIINMVSTEAMPGIAAYIATKQGLVGFSQSFAGEVGQNGVRVIAFAPGMVDTPGIRGAATELAPQLGISVEQFLSLSLHNAYAGLMPVEHAAAATAYLIVRLADEYHGEVVNGYTVLERAGLIQPANVAPEDTGERRTSVTVQTGASDTPPGTIAVAQCKQLQAAIEQMAEEFNKLPVFVRPLARNGFKSKAGQSIQDWARTAAGLTAQFERIASSSGVSSASYPDAPRLKDLLHKLIVYLEAVPAETARFTKDASLLHQVKTLSEQRIAVARAVIAVLDGVSSQG